MKTYKELRWFRTGRRTDILNITSQVEEVVAASGIEEGFALVYPMHTSSAVYVSDSDPSLAQDLEEILSRLVPQGAGYQHDRSDPKENADAHLRAILCGHHVTLPVSGGRLDLGTYQTVYYAEFDGKRDKEIQVKVLGS
jgi:secondary thiamine-phosphate synthase enzyme